MRHYAGGRNPWPRPCLCTTRPASTAAPPCSQPPQFPRRPHLYQRQPAPVPLEPVPHVGQQAGVPLEVVDGDDVRRLQGVPQPQPRRPLLLRRVCGAGEARQGAGAGRRMRQPAGRPAHGAHRGGAAGAARTAACALPRATPRVRMPGTPAAPARPRAACQGPQEPTSPRPHRSRARARALAPTPGGWGGFWRGGSEVWRGGLGEGLW